MSNTEHVKEIGQLLKQLAQRVGQSMQSARFFGGNQAAAKEASRLDSGCQHNTLGTFGVERGLMEPRWFVSRKKSSKKQ